jgi:murein DD-endopeptidase MepM/ murein hydrolase activator NlpD
VALPTAGLAGLTRLATLRFGAIPLNWAANASWFGYHTATRRAPTTYTVRRGDTFASIAKKHHVNWFNLAADNKLHMYSVLKTGEILRLPRPGEKAHAAMPMHAPAVTVTAAAERSSPAPSTTSSSAVAPSGSMSSFEQCVISRESGGNPEVMNGSGHWGLFQFSESTWVGYGGSPSAFGNASAAVQEQVFANAMARGGESNWAPYDGC